MMNCQAHLNKNCEDGDIRLDTIVKMVILD
jgi:hypothetical protein